MSKIELYNQDCMTAMAGMRDGEYELAIVDPPYGINAPNMSMGSLPAGSVDCCVKEVN